MTEEYLEKLQKLPKYYHLQPIMQQTQSAIQKLNEVIQPKYQALIDSQELLGLLLYSISTDEKDSNRSYEADFLRMKVEALGRLQKKALVSLVMRSYLKNILSGAQILNFWWRRRSKETSVEYKHFLFNQLKIIEKTYQYNNTIRELNHKKSALSKRKSQSKQISSSLKEQRQMLSYKQPSHREKIYLSKQTRHSYHDEDDEYGIRMKDLKVQSSPTLGTYFRTNPHNIVRRQNEERKEEQLINNSFQERLVQQTNFKFQPTHHLHDKNIQLYYQQKIETTNFPQPNIHQQQHQTYQPQQNQQPNPKYFQNIFYKKDQHIQEIQQSKPSQGRILPLKIQFHYGNSPTKQQKQDNHQLEKQISRPPTPIFQYNRPKLFKKTQSTISLLNQGHPLPTSRPVSQVIIQQPSLKKSRPKSNAEKYQTVRQEYNAEQKETLKKPPKLKVFSKLSFKNLQ